MAFDELWQVRFEPEAERQFALLGRISRSLQKEVIDLCDFLREEPEPFGAISMRKHKDLFRLRFGNEGFRMIYRADHRKEQITVIRIRPRDARTYRGFRNPKLA